MKRYQYIVAATCLCLSAMGFVGLYVTNQAEKQEEQAKNQQIVEESEDIILGSNLWDSADEDFEEETENQVADLDDEDDVANAQDSETDEGVEEEQEVVQQEPVEEEAPVGTITQEALHFNPENGVVWPIEGTVLLDYSMESTIFFPTLQQYQYNPAMIIAAKVNDKVYFVAKGKITDISTNEETGCTITQDIGDGYTAIYGQLKEVRFHVGDMVESGHVAGYVSEPTKYYSVEGSNVYFQLLKDGVPVDPKEILP
ncbi:MAG: M23 family metallopeptidase [Agathobacter sp.]|nr:M23 family metallopeptidase [Agathobacter sp.]